MPLHLLTLLILAVPAIAHGVEDFVPLVGIPYIDTQDNATTLGDYVNSLYWASISIAAVLAFLRITWAGIKYMLSEIVTDKASAKKEIKTSLLGLILILSAILILDTINPELKKLTALNLVPLTGDVTPEEPVSEPDAVKAMCESDAGCVREGCGLSVDCENWCLAEKNGIYLPQPGFSNDICVHPPDSDVETRIDEEHLGSLMCSQPQLGSGVIDCTAQIDACMSPESEGGEGGTRYAISEDGMFVECFKTVDVDTYDLTGTRIDCPDFNCDSEKAQCTSGGGIVTDEFIDYGYAAIECTQQNGSTASSTAPTKTSLGSIACETSGGEPVCDIMTGICDASSVIVDCAPAEAACSAKGGTITEINGAILSCYKMVP